MTHSQRHRAFVGVGANLRDPLSQVQQALESLRGLGPVTPSSLYHTEPLAESDQPWYVNAVAELYTGLEAEPLLSALKRLERLAGRSPRQAHSAPRILDLDLLLFDQQIVCTPSLTLPHPGLALRRFVLEPLAELAPDLQDPRSGRRVHELLSTLDDPLRVEKHQG